MEPLATTARPRYLWPVGGQALPGGVIMRGPAYTAAALRQPGGLRVEVRRNRPIGGRLRSVPFLRGMLSVVEGAVSGAKCMRGMAADTDKAARPLGGALAVGLLLVAPCVLAALLAESFFPTLVYVALLEEILRTAAALLAMALFATGSGTRTIRQYHGAEHKMLACYESGGELTVQNARAMPLVHARCGTGLVALAWVVFTCLALLIFPRGLLLRVISRAVMLPLCIAAAFEAQRYAAAQGGFAARVLLAPGLCLQRCLTAEPDDEQLEIALISLKHVLPKEIYADECG